MLAYSVRVFKVTFGTTCATTIVPIDKNVVPYVVQN